MDETEEFIQLVNNICLRPQMYTLRGSFLEIAAFFMGMETASSKLPIAFEDERTLNHFITARLLVPQKYIWAAAIRMATTSEEDAIAKLRDLLIEFATLTKTHSLAEIRKLAVRIRGEYVEPEPAKVWRRFLAARWSADQARIEPLIMDHPQAAVLWRGDGAPPGVAEQLMEISDSFVVSIVSGSLESGRVSLVTEIGIVEARLVDGSWRVDASSFIETDLAKESESRP